MPLLTTSGHPSSALPEPKSLWKADGNRLALYLNLAHHHQDLTGANLLCQELLDKEVRLRLRACDIKQSSNMKSTEIFREASKKLVGSSRKIARSISQEWVHDLTCQTRSFNSPPTVVFASLAILSTSNNGCLCWPLLVIPLQPFRNQRVCGKLTEIV